MLRPLSSSLANRTHSLVATHEPGFIAFVTAKVFDKIKTNYWPAIQKELRDIKISKGYDSDYLTVNNIHIQLSEQAEDAQLVCDEASDQVSLNINQIAIHGSADFTAHKWF